MGTEDPEAALMIPKDLQKIGLKTLSADKAYNTTASVVT